MKFHCKLKKLRDKNSLKCSLMRDEQILKQISREIISDIRDDERNKVFHFSTSRHDPTFFYLRRVFHEIFSRSRHFGIYNFHPSEIFMPNHPTVAFHSSVDTLFNKN